MKQKAYRQNPTVIDLSKKARPPPGETTLIYMNCLIIWILLTMPMRPVRGFSDGRILYVQKNFEEISKIFGVFEKTPYCPAKRGEAPPTFQRERR